MVMSWSGQVRVVVSTLRNGIRGSGVGMTCGETALGSSISMKPKAKHV